MTGPWDNPRTATDLIPEGLRGFSWCIVERWLPH